jgi:hypothetical protein
MTPPVKTIWIRQSILAGLVALGLLELSIRPAPAQTALTPASLPLYFEANQGQAASPAQFIARGFDCQFLFSPAGAQVVLHKATTGSATLQMTFVGANPRAEIRGDAEMAGKINYLTGNNPAQWKTGVPTFARVSVTELYPGIGLVYYGNRQRLEYDFTIAPGANPGAIVIHFDGAEKISISPAGELVLTLAGGEIRQPKPVIYQTVHGARQDVAGGYKILDPHSVAFSLGSYDRNLPLVIDPILSYSTYFGGNEKDAAWAVAVDQNGFVYIAGQTTSTQFKNWTNPPGAFLTNYQGGSYAGDAFVAKFDNLGTNLIYFTYLGGSGDDAIYGLAVDSAGDAYMAGATASANFPTRNWIINGAYTGTNISGTYNQYASAYLSDAFVAELNPGGSNLVYSTYLGGVSSDAARDIALDPAGNAYVTGFTYSTNFPTTPNAFQKRLGVTNWLYQPYYNGNAFVAEIAAGGSNLLYSSYFGGTNLDKGEGIALDLSNGVYLTGFTASINFPNTNSFQNLLNSTTNNSPDYDVYVAKFTPGFTRLVYSTFLGGGNNDAAYRIAVDASGGAYVTGWTVSTNYPNTVTNVAHVYSGVTNNLDHSYYPVITNAILTKVIWNGSNAAIGYSAVFGGTNFYHIDVGAGVAVDPLGDAFVIGATTSESFPCTIPASIPGLLTATNAGDSDVFITAFNADASALLYSALLGGSDNDYGAGIAVDPAGNAYIVGQTYSSNFPTNHARQATRNGTANAFLAKVLLLRASPTLAIVPGPGRTNVTLTRPAYLPEFRLESSPDPMFNTWSLVPEPLPPVFTNGQRVITLPMTGDDLFFRLHQF